MPFLPDHLLTPEQAIYVAVSDELQSFRNEWRADMASLNESIDRVFTDFANQIEQVKSGLVDALTAEQAKNADLTSENSDLAAKVQEGVDQLTALQSDVTAAQSRLDEKSTELEADDPAPEPPA